MTRTGVAKVLGCSIATVRRLKAASCSRIEMAAAFTASTSARCVGSPAAFGVDSFRAPRANGYGQADATNHRGRVHRALRRAEVSAAARRRRPANLLS